MRVGLQLGAAVVNYTQKTRRHHDRERFPLTAGWIMRVSRKLGQPVGRNRAYEIQHELIEAGVIELAGSYPHQRQGLYTGFKVALYRAGRALRSKTSSVPARSRQVAWWKHPFFGFGVESCPKEYRRRLRRWKEPPPCSKFWPEELRESEHDG
jgi:hypothetical protein